MLRLHPAFQALMTVVSFYALYLGLQRFRSLHLKQKAAFNWKRHVLIGRIVLVGWLLGLIGGLLMTRWAWHGVFITGPHAYLGVTMSPLIIFGLVSGWHMNRVKKKRTTLPLLHGLNNLLLVLLALVQGVTGVLAFRMFVLGL